VTGSATAVASAIRARRSFVLTSHARPDGDAIGSQLALAFALDALGKSVRLVDRDPAPAPYRPFPGVDRIELMPRVDGSADALIVLECSDLSRPGVDGLDRFFAINIDHHAGNTMYGAVNWFDESAAACAEMVAAVIDALGVAWTKEIATHLYLGIVTDTGGFRHAHITARTFELCRRVAAAGVDPAALARQIFDSFGIGRVKLTGALLDAMEIHAGGRLAVLAYDDALLARCGAAADDTENLVNLPLGARDIVATALFKSETASECRVSLRSKGNVDVRAVAARWGGGGHKNASGFTITGELAAARAEVISAVTQAIGAATGSAA
jgi:phosphoesterase RecJ-like protein